MDDFLSCVHKLNRYVIVTCHPSAILQDNYVERGQLDHVSRHTLPTILTGTDEVAILRFCWRGVATISRLLKIIGLFCQRAL